MKQLFITFLSFQLMILGQPTLAASIDEQREACNGSSQKWDSELNRCMTTQEAVDMRNDTSNCESSSDPEDCYMKQAEEKTGVKKGDKLEGNKLEMVGKIVAGAYSIFGLIASMGMTGAKSKSIKTSCISKKIFQFTSIAWVGGDLFLKHSAKKKFEEMAEAYDKEQDNTELKGSADSSYQSQVRAFHYLKSEQEQIQEQGKNRSKLQMAVAAGFAAALGFAIYELTPAGLPKRCTTVMKDGSDMSTEGATEGATAGAANAVKGPADRRKVFAKQVGKLGSSAQVALGSGIMLALNSYLIYHALNEIKRAEGNIETIDGVLATYSEFMAGFCPDGREDINNDRCYCYLEDGTKNENRTKSVICQNLFAQDEMNFALQNKSLKDLNEGPRQGCITVTGQFDIDCKCRKMVNTVSKQNACANTPNSALLTGGFGTQLDAPNAVNTLGKITNGANTGLASLNSAELAKKAARSDRLIGTLVKDVNKKGIKVKGPDDMRDFTEKLALASVSPKEIAKFNSGLAPRGATFGVPKGMDAALKTAEAKINLNKSGGLAIKAGTGKVGAGKKSGGYKFNWNDAAAREGNKVQTFMEKDYDYKGSDIVKRDDVSLWNVISNRYQTSGLRRLFGEDEDE